MGESSQNGIAFVDETYLLVLSDEDADIFPISDEKYAEQLHLQEALMSAAISYSRTADNKNNKTTDVEVKKASKLGKGKIAGTTSNSRLIFCPICMDYKPAGEMFQSSSCSHSFCMDCMGTYISTRIRENITGLNCPDPNCRAKLDPSNCRGVVPKEVVERWEDALCEAMILASEKIIYCPYKKCSAPLVDDDNHGGRSVIESECPSCHRLFCAKCMVPWLDHDGFSCEEFKSGGSSKRFDEMAAELARSMKWQRCPKCKFYVEKKEGCNHITCRCRYQFCYACGNKWTDHHSCAR